MLIGFGVRPGLRQDPRLLFHQLGQDEPQSVPSHGTRVVRLADLVPSLLWRDRLVLHTVGVDPRPVLENADRTAHA